MTVSSLVFYLLAAYVCIILASSFLAVGSIEAAATVITIAITIAMAVIIRLTLVKNFGE